MSALRSLLLSVIALLAIAGATACGSEKDEPLLDGSDGKTLSVRLDEWKVTLGASEVPASVSILDVKNAGAAAHELKLVRTDLAPDRLPERSSRVDEAEVRVVAETKQLKHNGKTSLDVRLERGSYVLICNISGHYELGMRAGLQVR